MCPNRANEVVWADGKMQIVHIDGRCNECGNCATFCPYASAPYLDKLTWFTDETAMHESHNPGFTLLGGEEAIIRLDGKLITTKLTDPELPADIAELMRQTVAQMPWLMKR